MSLERIFSPLLLVTALSLQAQDWKGPRGKILNDVKRAEAAREKALYLWPSRDVGYLHQVMDEKDENPQILGRLEVGVNGVKVFAEKYGKGYVIVSQTGLIEVYREEELCKAFSNVAKLYETGARIQKLGFPKGFVVPQRNPIIFHPGKNLEDSILEERLGKIDPELDSKLEGYGGREASRLYSPKSNSLSIGKQLGYLVDVWAPPEYIHDGKKMELRLKRFISTSDAKLPEHILVSMARLGTKTVKQKIISEVRDPKNMGSKYFFLDKVLWDIEKNMQETLYGAQLVVDDNFVPTRREPFLRFDSEIIIEGVNRY